MTCRSVTSHWIHNSWGYKSKKKQLIAKCLTNLFQIFNTIQLHLYHLSPILWIICFSKFENHFYGTQGAMCSVYKFVCIWLTVLRVCLSISLSICFCLSISLYLSVCWSGQPCHQSLSLLLALTLPKVHHFLS